MLLDAKKYSNWTTFAQPPPTTPPPQPFNGH